MSGGGTNKKEENKNKRSHFDVGFWLYKKMFPFYLFFWCTLITFCLNFDNRNAKKNVLKLLRHVCFPLSSVFDVEKCCTLIGRFLRISLAHKYCLFVIDFWGSLPKTSSMNHPWWLKTIFCKGMVEHELHITTFKMHSMKILF